MNIHGYKKKIRSIRLRIRELEYLAYYTRETNEKRNILYSINQMKERITLLTTVIKNIKKDREKRK